MSDSEVIIEIIRQRRETRDRIMFQNLIPILSQLRQTVDTWIDDEFNDLEDEISHLGNVAPTDNASKRITRYEKDVTQIRSEQMPKALKQLDELIRYIKQQKFKSSEEATEMLKKKLPPIISVVFSLNKARERLDSMAEMIPLPSTLPSPSHEGHERTNEE